MIHRRSLPLSLYVAFYLPPIPGPELVRRKRTPSWTYQPSHDPVFLWGWAKFHSPELDIPICTLLSETGSLAVCESLAWVWIRAKSAQLASLFPIGGIRTERGLAARHELEERRPSLLGIVPLPAAVEWVEQRVN